MDEIDPKEFAASKRRERRVPDGADSANGHRVWRASRGWREPRSFVYKQCTEAGQRPADAWNDRNSLVVSTAVERGAGFLFPLGLVFSLNKHRLWDKIPRLMAGAAETLIMHPNQRNNWMRGERRDWIAAHFFDESDHQFERPPRLLDPLGTRRTRKRAVRMIHPRLRFTLSSPFGGVERTRFDGLEWAVDTVRDRPPFVDIHLRGPCVVTGICTQAECPKLNWNNWKVRVMYNPVGWLESYRLSWRMRPTDAWTPLGAMTGNSDHRTPVFHRLDVQATELRLQPLSYRYRRATKIQVFGELLEPVEEPPFTGSRVLTTQQPGTRWIVQMRHGYQRPRRALFCREESDARYTTLVERQERRRRVRQWASDNTTIHSKYARL